MNKVLLSIIFLFAWIVPVFSEFQLPSYMVKCEKGCPRRGPYLAISPVSGAGFGLTANDISLRFANVAIGYDFPAYFGFEIEFDYDYFLEIDRAGDYNLLNSALNLRFYPVNGKVRPFAFVGGGVYTYLAESQGTSSVEYNLLGHGGLGLDIYLTRRSSLEMKAYPRYYNELGLPTDYTGYTSINFALLYKYTF